MTLFNLPSGQYGLIEVPEGAVGIRLSSVHNTIQWKEKEMSNKPYWDIKLLPPGSWTLIGICSEVGGEVAKGNSPLRRKQVK